MWASDGLEASIKFLEGVTEMTNKKDKEMKEQLETEALMDAEVEAATDCGCSAPKKTSKKDKEELEQVQAEAVMDAEVEAATDCGCGCGK